MIGRALFLLVLGCALGVFFAAFLGPDPARGAEVPAELRAPAPSPSTNAKDLSRPFVDATKKVRPAVVQVLAYKIDRTGQARLLPCGSGILVSKEGHILTNRHVIAEATVPAVKLADGRMFAPEVDARTGAVRPAADLLGADPRSDVAVLKLRDASDLPVATLGDSDGLEVGEWVVAIGAPFSLESSVSVGVVSAKGRTGVLQGSRYVESDFSEEFIQTDAALNPGNSGGPLINLDGQVVGINTAIETGGQIRANVGIGFAIPINLARTIAVSLIEHGIAQRGWLGISGRTVAAPGTPGGLLLEHVVPDSPAAKAGLRPNDVIVSVDGRPIRDSRMLVGRLAQAGPGGTVALRVQRGGGEEDVTVKLGSEPLETYGIEVETLTPEAARRMGLPADVTEGVVITKVNEGSAAATGRNRLYPSEVILRVITYGRSFRVNTAEEFRKVMNLLQAQRPRLVEFVIATKEGLYRVPIEANG
jgi:S1-C subfamily serine protease